MKFALLAFLFAAAVMAAAQNQTPNTQHPTPVLNLPARKADAITGSAFAKSIESLPLEARDQAIFDQVAQGNVPRFLRQLVPVDISYQDLKGQIFVAPDYLAIGTDEDYFFVPMTPYTAQRIADLADCSLPTPQMVDDIYKAATCKLAPSPIPPTPAMTTVPVFETHNATVKTQRAAMLGTYPLGALTAGDKKDIVICAGLVKSNHNVAIYGWHKLDGKPIQPLYLGHTASWADYSHGVRLVSETMTINGKACSVSDVLKSPILAGLLSGDGPLTQPRYVFSQFPHDWSVPKNDDWMSAISTPRDEKLERLFPTPGVRVIFDEPSRLSNNVRLVIYALPNGNTIEQTFGKTLKPGMDWHYDIQHIGAQTRFVRRKLTDSSLVVAYLQTDQKSWPSFLRAAGAGTATKIIDSVVNHFKGHDVSVVLDSHSGGGSLLFAYINEADAIPSSIERIAFLDSEYNYETSKHEAKFTNWLKEDNHFLCLIAYDDASALYQGKPFVSAEGGTWGRTHLMLQDFSKEFDIKKTNEGDPSRLAGLDGRLVFWFKENPAHEIFHTVQVERNGFIESLLSGTPLEGQGYVYFGERAYTGDIRK